VSEIEHFADARGISHRDAVVQMKLAPPDEAARGLAAELRLSFIDLEDMLPEDDVLDKVPRRTVKKYSCLPLFEDRGRLMVACADEPGLALEDELRMRFGIPMRAVIAVPRNINQAIAKYYAPGMRDEAVEPSTGVPDGGGAKSTKEKKPAAKKKERSKPEPISEEESRQRMQYSLIGICWSILGTVGIQMLMIDHFGMVNYAIAGGVGVVTAVILKLTYWR